MGSDSFQLDVHPTPSQQGHDQNPRCLYPFQEGLYRVQLEEEGTQNPRENFKVLQQTPGLETGNDDPSIIG